MHDTAKISLFLVSVSEVGNPDDLPLADAQKLKANTLSGKRKNEYCLGRLLLQYALNTCGLSEHQIIENDQGAPSIELGNSSADICLKNLEFSISHSKGWVGLAFCDSNHTSQLGLDLEKIKGDLSVEHASYFCNEQQIKTALTLDAKAAPKHFTRLWTHKEAFCKSQGLSVLSKHAKAADFSRDRRMHTGLLNSSHYVSIYSNAELTIQTKFLKLSNGDLVATDCSPTLTWESHLSR